MSLYKCATVSDNNYYVNEGGYTYGPWVRLFFTDTATTAVPSGDSGGPVMSSPSNGYIKARGIISRSSYNTLQGKSDVIYMPIDHIDDVQPIAVITSPSP